MKLLIDLVVCAFFEFPLETDETCIIPDVCLKGSDRTVYMLSLVINSLVDLRQGLLQL